jgi:hypothetical protein
MSVVVLPVPASASAEAMGQGIGLFDPGTGHWYLQNTAGQTASFTFGEPGDIPLVGDWDGDGIDTPAVYDPDTGWLTVRDWTDEVPGPLVYRRGAGWLEMTGADDEFILPDVHRLPAGGIPVVADPDGDGRDAVSIALDGRLHTLRSLPGPGEVTLGDGLQVPARTTELVAGDFDADGSDEFAAQDVTGRLVGVGETATFVNLDVGFGRPFAGDWDGNGVETPGAFDALTASFTLYHGMNGDVDTDVLAYGATGLVPVTGRFGALHGTDDVPARTVGLPAMQEGDTGAYVAVLQQELKRRGLYLGEIDGVFGEATKFAVMAFHKALDVERTWNWELEDTLRLTEFSLPPLPERPDEPDRVEVDIGHQLLFVFEDHEVVAIVPVSTGGSYVYYSPRNDAVVAAGTPRGDFTLFGFAWGWHCDPLTGWCIYNPWSFTEYYALHGYRSVPEYPASHGCVRITTWDSDILSADYLFPGMPIHIWDEYEPEVDEETTLG